MQNLIQCDKDRTGAACLRPGTPFERAKLAVASALRLGVGCALRLGVGCGDGAAAWAVDGGVPQW